MEMDYFFEVRGEKCYLEVFKQKFNISLKSWIIKLRVRDAELIILRLIFNFWVIVLERQKVKIHKLILIVHTIVALILKIILIAVMFHLINIQFLDVIWNCRIRNYLIVAAQRLTIFDIEISQKD